MPSVAVLGLNRFGEKVYDYLADHEATEVVGLFTEPSQYAVIKKLAPDYLISAGFDHIVPESLIDAVREDAVNLHPSYLPYNRGVNPDVWSIIREEPAGVTIHYMTPAMDAGKIIAQQKVSISPEDTGRSLRQRLDKTLVRLFENEWENIYTGAVEETEQRTEESTTNYRSEFSDLCELDLNDRVKTGTLLDRLRALTFHPYNNAYFEQDGTRYYVRVSIESEENVSADEFVWDTPTLF